MKSKSKRPREDFSDDTGGDCDRGYTYSSSDSDTTDNNVVALGVGTELVYHCQNCPRSKATITS